MEQYREFAWVRRSLNTGEPLAKPKAHLSLDGKKTCCGITIPRTGTEKNGYRIDETETSYKCERCFTDKREQELLDDY